MEPLNTITLGSCKWLGVLALAGMIAAELLSPAHEAHMNAETFAGREMLRRARNQSRAR